MKEDIYDSMAEGVQGAIAVVSCMSPSYQNSENCKLELKFAQQSGIPIVPVMMVPADTWKASGWLGIITAGTLWTQITEDLKDSVDKLVLQIQRTLENRKLTGESDTDDGDTDHSSTEDDELEFSVDEMRAELERLMADLRNNRPGARETSKIEGDVSKGMCVVPAGTPILPSGLRVTTDMEGLLKALLATRGTDTSQVGFCGMGGMKAFPLYLFFKKKCRKKIPLEDTAGMLSRPHDRGPGTPSMFSSSLHSVCCSMHADVHDSDDAIHQRHREDRCQHLACKACSCSETF